MQRAGGHSPHFEHPQREEVVYGVEADPRVAVVPVKLTLGADELEATWGLPTGFCDAQAVTWRRPFRHLQLRVITYENHLVSSSESDVDLRAQALNAVIGPLTVLVGAEVR